jgi:hypothetical protein
LPPRARQGQSNQIRPNPTKSNHIKVKSNKSTCNPPGARAPGSGTAVGGLRRAVPPHPGPLPRGEGELPTASWRSESGSKSRGRSPVVPSPWGEGTAKADSRHSRGRWFRRLTGVNSPSPPGRGPG